MQKPSETQYPIHELLKTRWSPRAFSSQPVEEESLLSLFEAARWSPSGGNTQPWSFIVVNHENQEVHQKLVETMTGQNPAWAKNAPTLVVAIAKLNAQRPAFNRYAYYDLGQAVAHLNVQASALGLHIHQMGGFDTDKARELLGIPEGYEPMTVIAIGYFGKLDELSTELREREKSPRTRKDLSEFVFSDYWQQPLSFAPAELLAGD